MDSVKIERKVNARIPTTAGEFQLYLYTSDQDDKEQLALVLGDVKGKTNVLVRVHSECFTGDVLGSLRCDCGEQLNRAIQMMDGNDIEVAIASVVPGVHFLEPQKAREMARRCNDYSAELCARYPARFGAFATVPMHEARHAVEAIDPFAYAEEFPDQWREFRESALTRLLDRLRATLTVSHPSLLVTVGAASDPDGSVRDHFQDWRAWLERGIVDRIGYPSRSSGIVLFSADGAIPPDPVPATSARGAADGEPR